MGANELGSGAELAGRGETRDRPWGTLPGATLLGTVCYALLAMATIALTTDGRSHATAWPADAVILALLLSRPRRDWPVLLLGGWAGNLVANGVTRGWVLGLVLYGAINMVQTLLAAHVVRRTRIGDDVLADPRTFLQFLFWAGLVAPLIGAILGAGVSQALYGQAFGASFVRWYASNALGFVIFTPFFVSLFSGAYARALRAVRRSEIFANAGFFALHCAVALTVLLQARFPALFLIYSTLLLLSFRMGRLATQIGVMVVALIGATALAMHVGPLQMLPVDTGVRVVLFQIYLAVLLCTALPVAAVVAARADDQAALAAREQMLRLIMERSPDAILGFDGEGVCRWADGPLRACIGMEAPDLIGLSAEAVAERSGQGLARLVRDRPGDAGEHRTAELIPPQRPGVTLEASLRHLDSRHRGQAIETVITLRDITARKAREAAISRRAETDDLTGLYNRAGFRARMSLALGLANLPVTLALIDVDHFKAINDSHGHAAGDIALAEIARRLRAGTREIDVVGRLGGDEFAILFRCGIESAWTVCERIAHSITAEPIMVNGNVVVLTSISCGLAPLREGLSRETLFEAADLALYEAKRGGRNAIRAAA